MSDAGALMDKLVTAAETVSGVTAERGFKVPGTLSASDYPYCSVFEPDETVTLGDFLLPQVETTISMLLYTKGETQEATLLKIDGIRDAIAADRTLGGLVQYTHVSSRQLREDPRDDVKGGAFVVETLEQSGHVFTVDFELEATLVIGQTDYAAIDTAIETMLNTHIGASSRLAGSQWRRDHTTIAVDTHKYQLQMMLGEVVRGSNEQWERVKIRVLIHRHIGLASSEATYVETILLPAINGLMDPATWLALAAFHEVTINPDLSLDNVTRED
jgi:hypothetical protein